MALARHPVKYIPPEAAEYVLHNGDLVSVRKGRMQTYEVSVGRMTVSQLMLLGIPLDFNRMGEKEWELLPGVGPELAKRIVCYRQYNGEFSSIRDLVRVPGIGPGILAKIQEYFEPRNNMK
jgi:competence protein ComEA